MGTNKRRAQDAPRGSRRVRWSAVALACLMLFAVTACGSSDDSADSSTTTAGSGGGLPTGMEPQPLPSPTTVKVALSGKFDSFLNVLVGDSLGEFKKENITIEYVTATGPDQLQLLASNQVDATLSTIPASLFNAINQGEDLKVVGPLFQAGPEDLSGLWVSSELLSGGNLDANKFRGNSIASVGGEGSTTSFVIQDYLADYGITPDEINYERLTSPPDVLTALQNGAVKAAWLYSPTFREVANDPNYKFLVGQPNDASLGSILYGSTLLNDKPVVGQAFMRAVARTVNEHLQGNYFADPAVLAAASEQTGIPPERLRSNPMPVFNPNLTIKPGLMPELEEAYRLQGTVTFPNPLPEDSVVDRRFIENALK